jgi:hypothetical protein
MNIPRLFKLPEHRKFSYHPLYYNPDQDEREIRMRNLKVETGIRTEGYYGANFQRGAMKSYFKRGGAVQKQSKIRLIIILIFLVFVSYILLFR